MTEAIKYPVSARRLRQAMSDKNMKAVELSNITGIGKSSISHYMNGTHWPDDNRRVGLLADALDVSPSWLMGFDVPKTVQEERSEYYINPDTARIAQEIFDDPHLRALFDAAQDCDPADMEMAADLLRRLKGTNPDG